MFLKNKFKSISNKTLTNISTFSNINIIKSFFCEKSDVNNEINEINNETVDIKNVIDIGPPNENKLKIGNIYNISSKKMGKADINKFIDKSKITNPNVKLSNFTLDKFHSDYRKSFIPVSPKLGPFEVIEPKLEGKTYHWCACGMSKNQPFCDMSHRNSKIRPISFKLGEKCDNMQLCGCKLSTKVPFCDGKTCVDLKVKEEEEMKRKIEKINLNENK